MTALQILSIAVCSALAILFIVIRTLKGGHLAFVLKTIASLGFVICGIIYLGFTGSDTWASILIVLGLLLGMIGDIVLDLKVIYPDSEQTYLNMGMASFFLGHGCYIAAFTILEDGPSLLLPILISAGVAIILTAFTTISGKKVMGLNFGNYIIQTIAYTYILSFALVYTISLAIIGSGLWLTVIGLALFLLSDIVLSFQYFGGKIASKPLIAVNHTLYYAAQIILLSVLFII